MEMLFLVKSVLNQMDRLGANVAGISNLATRAAKDLGLPVDHRAVVLAAAYMKYELHAMSYEIKPEGLAEWYLKLQAIEQRVSQ